MRVRIISLLFLINILLLFSCSDDHLVEDESVIKLGIGTYLKESADNGVVHQWYYDQGESGQYADINCGPACATMAIKWKNQDWNHPVEYFRRSPGEQGNWWNTKQIRDTMTKYKVDCMKKVFRENSLKADLQYGSLVILCVDCHYITYNEEKDVHWGRFYEAGVNSGHFIIAKGYKVTDKGLWLEIYDPLSNGKKYDNGQFMGKDRYYHIDDITEASDEWWNYYIKVK